ncbi:TetR/AcrR family transcriptional regulator [Pseudonocardia sp.]|uniref:TetR/AcrR family transcriptional regulator n=1 Tax=Pseudonocardia sp. TaxID=60912 RepID=UPI002620E870|nr:TetR/AcrR family transcriptional regulator [Pseudonocardia sp.]
MTDRRTEILDAALLVLADHGMRGLTHRAVDGAAGIAPGSTSYYFRSRSALVAGCVERLLALDVEREMPALVAPRGSPLDVLVAVGVSMATDQRHRTLARYELSLAAVRDPALRAELRAGGDTIRRLGAEALAHLGAVEPDAAAAEIAALLDGLVFTALVRGPDDPVALAAWLRPPLARTLTALTAQP